MSTYTTNLNLIKPGYDDDIDVAQLNNNSDVIDTQITNVINANDNHNVRLTALENKEYPYLPLEGGNLTGDLTIEGRQIRQVIDSGKGANEFEYWVKYNDGALVQVVTIENLNNSGLKLVDVTLLQPYINTKYIVTSNYETYEGRSPASNTGLGPTIVSDTTTLSGRAKTTTRFTGITDSYTRAIFTCVGRWK